MARAHHIVEDTAKAMGIQPLEVFTIGYKMTRQGAKYHHQQAILAFQLWEKDHVISDDMLDFCADILSGRIVPILMA